MPAKLSTHVLDIAQGCPAQGVQIELWSLAGEARKLLKTARTNADGRTDQPLLAAEEMRVGDYELVFYVGDYFAGKAASRAASPLPGPGAGSVRDCGRDRLLSRAAAGSPWAYSTYRGS